MQGTRGSSPRRSTNQLSRSSKAERPADNRETADRYRAGEPATGDRHDHDDQKTGAAGRRISIADGPGAFKPKTVGQRAFNPRAKGFDSSRVLQPHHTTSSTGESAVLLSRRFAVRVRGRVPVSWLLACYASERRARCRIP